MPKKHRQTYQSTKPGTNYVHPSLSGSPRSTSSGPTKPSTLSVNERLSNLRLAHSSPAAAERARQLAELSNQRSLPPSLGQGILGHSVVAAPNPRNNNALRSRIRLRTPGPAPPPSWSSSRNDAHGQVLQSRYHAAPRQARTFGNKIGPERKRPQERTRFLNMTNGKPVKAGSLLDMSLRTAALNWADIVEDCFDSLDVIPAHIRVALLSYLTSLGPPEGIDMNGIHALFPDPTDAASLDFSGLVGWGFSLKELRKWLHTASEVSKEAASKRINSDASILESWDQESPSDSDRSNGFSIPATLSSGLQHLTRLSLAFPPSSVSWVDLLSLSKDLHTITHLSLAGWPLPTRTPNMTSPYAALDRDFQESALVLRMLSENTYCLRWLDLQGNNDWLSALTWRSTTQPPPPPPLPQPEPSNPETPLLDANASTTRSDSSSSSSSSDWTPQKQKPQCPNFNTSWRHLSYLNLSQPPNTTHPTNRAILSSPQFRNRMAQKHFRITPSHRQIIDDLRDRIAISPEREYQQSHCRECHEGDFGECRDECVKCGNYLEAQIRLMARWLERELDARGVARAIVAARKSVGGLRCVFDHGWLVRESYPAVG